MPRRRIAPRPGLLVGLAYLVLVLGFTWPLPLHLADRVILARGNDVWQHLWNFSWVRTALLAAPHSPYFTHGIFYPDGVPLVYHALNLFSAVLSLPLQLLWGLVPAFNLLMIGNLLAAALAANWLARVLGLDRGPSFLAGLLFGFSSPLAVALTEGQGELVSVFWMPLYIGLLLRGAGWRAVGLPPAGYAYLVGAGLALAGSLLAVPYWFVSLLVWTGVYALTELWAVRQGGRAGAGPVLGRLALTAAVTVVVLGPLLLLMVRDQARSDTGPGITQSATTEAVTFNGSQDPVAWLRPLPGRGDPGELGNNGHKLGLGWLMPGLALLALLGSRGVRRRALGLWAGAAATLAVLTLGPSLVFNGQDTGIPLPYALILRLPGAAAMRLPLRFNTLLMLCLAVLAAYGLALLSRPTGAAWRRSVVAVVAVALVVGELFGAPRPLVSAAVPVFFQQLAAQPSPCLTELQRPLSGCDALLELPQDPWGPLGMYHAAVSRHPMVGGYTSRHYPYSFAGDAPGVAQLVAPTAADLGPDIYTPSLRDLALRTMDYYGLRYVVVHPLDEYRAADAL
ncbi:MAG TPA: hypothetical protein VM536_21785, partial [Chloroflexia bacterium]|nr:hypothetical protein [Chloroflexia bacterium]